MMTAAPPQQTLSRLLNPIGSTNQETTFVIPAIGNGILRNDVVLHFGVVVTRATNKYPTYNPLSGAYAMVSEITIQDAEGRRLYNVKNADRYCQTALLGLSASCTLDVLGETALTQRSVQARDVSATGGQLYTQAAQDWPTENPNTTARVALDLRRIVSLFASEIPLAALRELRITILWQQTVNNVFTKNAATAMSVDRPQLTYSVRVGGPPPPETLQLVYEEPLSMMNALAANSAMGAASAQLPMGGGGMRATRVIFALTIDPTGTDPVPPASAPTLDKTTRLNVIVNGRPLYPTVGLAPHALLNESDRAFGPWSLPVCAFTPGLDLINSPGGSANALSGAQTFYGFGLKPIPVLAGSIVNCLQLDSSGIYLVVSGRTEDIARTVYGWLMVPRVLSIANGMVAGFV